MMDHNVCVLRRRRSLRPLILKSLSSGKFSKRSIILFKYAWVTNLNWDSHTFLNFDSLVAFYIKVTRVYSELICVGGGRGGVKIYSFSETQYFKLWISSTWLHKCVFWRFLQLFLRVFHLTVVLLNCLWKAYLYLAVLGNAKLNDTLFSIRFCTCSTVNFKMTFF